MKRLSCLVLLLSAALLLPGAARAQDDQYIRIYDLIQQGDALSSANQSGEALIKYQQARTALESFQRIYPAWNSKVVNFRLTYLEAKISSLTIKAIPSGTPARNGTPPVTAPTPSTAPSAADRQQGMLQDQIRQLEAEKMTLESKLKEAFTAQPTADPRELSNAQETIQSLTKENALLKVGLTNAPAGVAPAQGLDEMRRIFADTSHKLADQVARANTLESENQALQGRLNAIPSNVLADLEISKKALAEANQQLADKSALADRLLHERDDLQARLESLQTHLDGMALQTNMSIELTATKKALGEANQKLTEQSSLAARLAQERDDLQTRNQSLQSQLDALALSHTNALVELAGTKKALGDVNQKLTDQSGTTDRLTQERDALRTRIQTLLASAGAVEALRAENNILKEQAATAKTTADEAAEQGRKLAAAEARFASLQSEVGVLNLEKAALQDRMKKTAAVPVPVAPAKSAPRPEDLARIKQLERERDDLQKKLEAADKKAAAALRPVKSVVVTEGNLNAQVSALRARLEVLEAKPVPYTSDELALFKKSPTKLVAANPKPPAKTDTNAVVRPGNMLPAGSAPLAAEAQRLFSARKFDQAEAKYLEILRKDENNSYTLANLAAIQLEMNHVDAAQKHIEQAIAIAPDDGYNLSVLGFLRFRQERYDEALNALSRAATLDPKNPEIQNYLGVTLSHKGLRGPAETALRTALQINPNYGDAHNNLAVIYATQKPPLLELARWHYQRALAVGQPHNPELEKLLK